MILLDASYGLRNLDTGPHVLVQRGVSGFTGARVDNFAATGDSKKILHDTSIP